MIAGHRLLDIGRLARRGDPQGIIQVAARRRGDVHGVDFRVLDQLVRVGGPAGHAVTQGVVLRLRRAAPHGHDQRTAGGLLEAGTALDLGNVAASDHPPTNRHAWFLLSRTGYHAEQRKSPAWTLGQEKCKVVRTPARHGGLSPQFPPKGGTTNTWPTPPPGTPAGWKFALGFAKMMVLTARSAPSAVQLANTGKGADMTRSWSCAVWSCAIWPCAIWPCAIWSCAAGAMVLLVLLATPRVQAADRPVADPLAVPKGGPEEQVAFIEALKKLADRLRDARQGPRRGPQGGRADPGRQTQ